VQAAVVARLQDDGVCEHRDGLLKALQLCERFINSNAASDAAYAVLKQEAAKAMLQTQQQVGRCLGSQSMIYSHGCCCYAARQTS
jgi:hypothetical protein